MPTPIEVLPQLYVAGIGKKDIPPDYKAEFDAVLDLRHHEFQDPKHDGVYDIYLRHLAGKIADAIRAGFRILLVDEHGRDRVSLVSALVLMVLKKMSGASAESAVRRLVPGAFEDRPKYAKWLQGLIPGQVTSPPPMPKRSPWTESEYA